MNPSFLLVGLGAIALPLGLWAALKLRSRLQLSLAKHRSLAGHPRMARRIAKWLPYYSYDEARAFAVDGAPAEVIQTRRAALASLGAQTPLRCQLGLALQAEVQDAISDLQFTSAYKIPFQFRAVMGSYLHSPVFMKASQGVQLTDLDGNTYYDLAGSYGVNLLGYDFYKHCITAGAALVQDLGPVLGVYHPVVADNVKRLRAISGQSEVSFHMSGTEAVMQAVRLARYHSRRNKVVRFCGAYHGWGAEVQPGVGNPMTQKDTLTLKELDATTLKVLRTRNDIACVLINPLQALHPNASAPADSSLLSSSRQARFMRADYTKWLQALREVCSERGIALIFDEVFVGFRLARGGAQAYFGVRADIVAYGKTLGGGLPVGVLCGAANWMRRFRDDAPADICFARGTFNSHPYVMGAMNVFLQQLDAEQTLALYATLDATWEQRAKQLNDRLNQAALPVQVANLSSIWTVLYTKPSCYNWLLQYYLRREGLALSWVGSGRLIFSLNYSDADFEAVVQRFVNAAQRMVTDGWWWNNPQLSNKAIQRRVLRELIAHRFGLAASAAAPQPLAPGRVGRLDELTTQQR